MLVCELAHTMIEYAQTIEQYLEAYFQEHGLEIIDHETWAVTPLGYNGTFNGLLQNRDEIKPKCSRWINVRLKIRCSVLTFNIETSIKKDYHRPKLLLTTTPWLITHNYYPHPGHYAYATGYKHGLTAVLAYLKECNQRQIELYDNY